MIAPNFFASVESPSILPSYKPSSRILAAHPGDESIFEGQFTPDSDLKSNSNGEALPTNPMLYIGLMASLLVGLLHVWVRRPSRNFGICQEEGQRDQVTPPHFSPGVIEIERSVGFGRPPGSPVGVDEEEYINVDETETGLRIDSEDEYNDVESITLNNQYSTTTNRMALIEERNNQVTLKRIGVVQQLAQNVKQDNMQEMDKANFSSSDMAAGLNGFINGIVLQYSNGYRTGRIINFSRQVPRCFFDMDINDDFVLENTIDYWILVDRGDTLTHFQYTTSYHHFIHDSKSASSSTYLSPCMFQNVTLFMASGKFYNYGMKTICNEKKSKSFNIEIPEANSDAFDLFSLPRISIPLILFDVGYRLKGHSYKGCNGKVHKMFLEAACISAPWLYLNEKLKRDWVDISKYLMLCREDIESMTFLLTELLRAEGWFEWTPLHIACDCSAPIDVIQLLLEYAPESGSMKDHCGRTPYMLVKGTRKNELKGFFYR